MVIVDAGIVAVCFHDPQDPLKRERVIEYEEKDGPKEACNYKSV